MATKTKASRPVPLPTIGRQGPGDSKTPTTPKNKLAGTGNGSILRFFKKADGDEAAQSDLFVADSRSSQPKIRYGPPSPELGDEYGELRFNENEAANKRRRVGVESVQSEDAAASPVEDQPGPPAKDFIVKSGPFFEESDSEVDEGEPAALVDVDDHSEAGNLVAGTMPEQDVDPEEPSKQRSGEDDSNTKDANKMPRLIKEETSYEPGLDEFGDFGDEDFEDDPYEEGDEFRERRYLEEQARLEEEENDEEDQKDCDPLAAGDQDVKPESSSDNAIASTCPICSISLGGVSEQDAGVHVNNCLDGNPTPLPERKPASKAKSLPFALPSEKSASATHYPPIRPPKPGQANPFDQGGEASGSNGKSAFSKLMSGHTEESAWAQAAASEHAARGKPSYQRTCPFYKILPGLFICVDAFRYGAVKGCQAYFLSHFHSDHYVGLTSTWRHGLIYCSKVTANLVRQQLRVDPQYVVPLEFEKTVEVPGTEGVRVTMISANHCPGSSLYLFEKTTTKHYNGKARLQRILHCGDFRACKMHVQHPLLMPDIVDKVSGKTHQQKIDVCYLDTTYLDPKYAFPSQDAVIKACADMCVCLSKDTPDEDDGWERMKRQRAGEGMTKFIGKESNAETKKEEVEEGTKDDMTIKKNPHTSQQILSSIGGKNTRGRLLVVVGTYSIGKERVCLGIARALKSKIFAPTSKRRIVAALEDPELDELMTDDPRAAQVHMTPLFEIRAETLDDYLKDFFPHFTRAVGFRPSGWNYKPPNSRFTASPLVQTVLHSDNWRSTYSMRDLVAQRGSSSRASCFAVPYSEHSSFRELTMFCCALRIDKVIPTVNVGSAKGRERMKGWCERWAADRNKNGLYKIPTDGSW